MRPFKWLYYALKSHSIKENYIVAVKSYIFYDTKTIWVSRRIEKKINKKSSKPIVPNVKAAPK